MLHSYTCTIQIDIGTTAARAAKQQQSCLSSHMKLYQEYLKHKYYTLEMTSPDEMLDCYSPDYIDLVLVKGYKRKPIKQRSQYAKFNCTSEYVTISEALNVEGEKKKIVLIEGGPGMGKTTLAIYICKCWAKGELLQNYNAVILLTLRDPEVQETKTISDLLLIKDDDLRNNVFKEVMKNFGDRICFILEGFDELPKHLRKSSVFTKVIEHFPKCMLIYTTRPKCYFDLCSSIHIHASQLIKINGYVEESTNLYILKTFENEIDGDVMAYSLMKQIDRNPEIKRILHIPINVALVCFIFFHSLKLPDKLTDLYISICIRLIFRHIVKRTCNETNVEALNSLDDLPEEISREFLQLCYIAYYGICNSKVIFTSKDLCDMNVADDKMSGLGLLLVAPSMSVSGIRKSYNFLHKTLQEFCAAWYISKLPTEKQIQHFYSYLNQDEDRISSQMVWRFYSGITGLKDMKVVNSVWPCKSVISPHETDKLFVLMKLVYEADNNLVCQMLGDCFYGNIDIEKYDEDYFDDAYNVDAMNYFLTHYKGKVISLHIPEKISVYKGVYQLVRKSLQHRLSLNKTIFPSISMRFAFIYNFDLGDLFSIFANSFTPARYCVVEIHICRNYKETHMELLSRIVCYSKTLKVLHIESDKFGCKGALSLAECRNIVLEDLRLPFCMIGTHGMGAIGKMILYNNSIKSVNLRCNCIRDAGIKAFVHHLERNNTLQSLNLEDNSITEIGAINLKEILGVVCCMKLSGNPLGHIGIYLMLERVTVPMKCIELFHGDTSYAYCSVAGILDKVESISFVAPDDDEGCNTICKSLVNTTMLEQLKIGIYTSDLNHHNLLLNAIGKNNNIRKLEISYRLFTDEYAMCLAEFITVNKSLRSLSFGCLGELSPQGLLLIADSLTVNTSITYMEISNDCGLYDHNRMDGDFVLKFLYRLKQASTLKWLALWISVCTVSYKYVIKGQKLFEGSVFYTKFYQKVNLSIQQINYTRKIKGIYPLELKINGYLEKD